MRGISKNTHLSYMCSASSAIMQARSKIALILCCFVAFTRQEYFWRDYDCVVPDDAIPGGYDRYGNVTYIGQAFLTSGAIVPVSIKNGDCSVNAGYSYNVQKTSFYVKVLCSSSEKENFQWIPVTSKTVQMLIKYHLVVGGAASSCLFKIGRVLVQQEVIVGRVTCDLDNAVLYVAADDKELSANTYEILVQSSEIVSLEFAKALQCKQ